MYVNEMDVQNVFCLTSHSISSTNEINHMPYVSFSLPREKESINFVSIVLVLLALNPPFCLHSLCLHLILK